MKINSGQSLVEILVAIAVVTLVLVTLVAAVVMAIRGVRFSKEKIRANFLNQEGMEWARSQRQEKGWADFGLLATGAGARYCLVDLSWDRLGSCSESQIIDTKFTREAVLTTAGSDGVKVAVTTTWDEGGSEFVSKGETTLRQWDIN